MLLGWHWYLATIPLSNEYAYFPWAEFAMIIESLAVFVVLQLYSGFSLKREFSFQS